MHICSHCWTNIVTKRSCSWRQHPIFDVAPRGGRCCRRGTAKTVGVEVVTRGRRSLLERIKKNNGFVDLNNTFISARPTA